MKILPENTIVGFIGLGVMGKSMAGHILDAGYPLHVFTRTRKSADDLVKRGAVWEQDVSDLCSECNLIISIVGFPADVEEIYLGENGILKHAEEDSIAVDMTTSSPELAVRISEQLKERNIHALDAPVSGGDIGARNATLSIMAGGDETIFNRVLPILEIMGDKVVYQGPAGSGQHTKMANQIAIASGMIGVCEALAYSIKSGLDPETVLRSIGGGAAGSWSLNNLGPRMIKGDMEPGFYVKHFLKDMLIASESSKNLSMETPGLDLAISLYESISDKGLSDKGTQALFKLFAG